MLRQEYIINENKINNWLDELDQDRRKLFDSIKTSKETDKVKEDRIRSLELIQRSLMTYKKLLNKQKSDAEKL